MMKTRRVGSLMLSAGLAIALTGCDGSSKAAAPNGPPTASQTTVRATHPATTLPAPTTTASPASSTTTMTSAAPAGAGYTAARAQWIGSGLVISSAYQNAPLAIAVQDLEDGESTDSGGKSGYAETIAAIEDYERLPITSVTPAERAEAKADFDVINTFFDLRGTTSPTAGCLADPGSPAATAWGGEPSSTTAGILVAPLQEAVTNLEQRVKTNGCFPAAIDDLRHLETATSADIQSSSQAAPDGGVNVYGADIVYLNALFQTDVLMASP